MNAPLAPRPIEFHGVPTRTCGAIGPAWIEDVDAITGALPLL